jgi:Arc/MetJ family transcription regulator
MAQIGAAPVSVHAKLPWMDIEFEVDLDDKLIAELIECTGITDVNELVRRALQELVDREERRRGIQPKQTD